MTPDRLQQIEELFHSVREASSDERAALLEQADPELRREVESLLARQNDRLILDRSIQLAGDPATTVIEGRRLSGYTLLREIGRGGMGSVYAAERSDKTFHRQAAIKLVLPPANSAAIVARFQQEREILASLDHPSIAKLLDAGVTEEGWPYFVMEFVDGQPIDSWCDERKLNTTQRVELFRGVISAVRYAHQHLVVHRDLKPGNIFVTHDGIVKLLDFGIAKVLSPTVAGRALDTVTLARMMTPEYASPEQVNGTAITTLSDVYSLGVVLYELLTGHRPYRLLSAAMHEMARVIAEEEPVRPSEVVTTTEPAFGRDGTPITPGMVSAVREGDPDRLRKRLAGDLDSILLMSLRKEPDRRYSSVEAFAGDLERHLEHRPVAARESTAWYRMRRFYQRNVGAVVAGFLVMTALLAGLVAVIWQTRREMAPTRATAADMGPFVVFAFGVVLVSLGLAVYLARPSRYKFLGALTGGAIWAGSSFGHAWLAYSHGWWQKHGAEKPLVVFGQPVWRSPYVWIADGLALTAVMFLVFWIQKRFGWKWGAIFSGAWSVFQVNRDRYWFSTILPAIEYKPDWWSILTETGLMAAGGLVALFVMRVIVHQSERRTKAAGSH